MTQTIEVHTFKDKHHSIDNRNSAVNATSSELKIEEILIQRQWSERKRICFNEYIIHSSSIRWTNWMSSAQHLYFFKLMCHDLWGFRRSILPKIDITYFHLIKPSPAHTPLQPYRWIKLMEWNACLLIKLRRRRTRDDLKFVIFNLHLHCHFIKL